MEVMKKYNIPRLFVIALVIVSLVAFSCYTAPKAQAEALAFTLTTGFIMLVIAVMATLGVTLVSPSDSVAVDAITTAFGAFLREVKGNTSSIAEYLSSIGLGVISLIAAPIHGAISIGKVAYDLIAEFCTWFFGENNVESGGDPVGDLPQSVDFGVIADPGISLNGTPSYTWMDSTTVSVTIPAGSIAMNSQRNIYIGGIPASDLELPCSVQISDYRSIPSQFTNVSVGLGPTANANNNNFWFRQSGSNYQDTVNVTSTQYGNYLNVRLNSTFSSGASWSAFTITIVLAAQTLVDDGGFVVYPSANVLNPPSLDVGQTYNVPAEGVTDTSDLEDAIPAAIAPLTTTGGLTNTGTVGGTAVPSEWVWLYEGLQGINVGVESIKNNTSDDKHGTDFVPSSTTMDFGFWHYVPDWISSVGAGFSMLVGVVTSLPSIMLAPLYGILVLGIVVALFHKLWGS